MREQLDHVGADTRPLASSASAADVVNVRFRPRDVRYYEPRLVVPPAHPAATARRYQLLDWSNDDPELLGASEYVEAAGQIDDDSDRLRSEMTRRKKSVEGVSYDPQHVRLQNALYHVLVKRYGKRSVDYERDYVDLTVSDGSKKILYEIKIAQTAKPNPDLHKVLHTSIGGALPESDSCRLKRNVRRCTLRSVEPLGRSVTNTASTTDLGKRRLWLARGLWGVGISASLLVLVILALHVRLEPDRPNAFVGSAACAQCHHDVSADWTQSLHRKMMRRVDDPDAVLAQWDVVGKQPAFSRQEAVWVVGSKWEQQFMGHDKGHDTMLPGAWSVGLKSWTLQGWDGWQAPVPEQRCHGCHTVGLDKTSGHFVEAGIGCESCHGQGQWHLDAYGHGPIYAQLDSEACGQCHTRGHTTEGPFFFPVGYVLGESLDTGFKEIDADFLQNSSQWWGNGRERDRHQEYPAWRRGGHANALKALLDGYDGRYGRVDGACLRCHSAEGAVRPEQATALADAKNGITCVVCHNVHGQLDQLRSACESCHDQGPFHHEQVALEQHVPCPSSAGVKCADCHMPITVKVGGQYQLHSHAPGITPPKDGTRFESPSSCANGACHEATPAEQLQHSFEVFYERVPKPPKSATKDVRHAS